MGESSECETAVARNLFGRYDSAQKFDEPERILLDQCAQLSAQGAASAQDRDLTTEPILLETWPLTSVVSEIRRSPRIVTP